VCDIWTTCLGSIRRAPNTRAFIPVSIRNARVSCTIISPNFDSAGLGAHICLRSNCSVFFSWSFPLGRSVITYHIIYYKSYFRASGSVRAPQQSQYNTAAAAVDRIKWHFVKTIDARSLLCWPSIFDQKRWAFPDKMKWDCAVMRLSVCVCVCVKYTFRN